MMRVIFIIIAISTLVSACGIKEKPVYESKTQYNKTLYKI